MKLGPLNRKVTLQQLVAGQDDHGQPETTWSDVASIWASIRYLNGTQAIKADADASVTKASIRIRRRTDVTTAMRVVHQGVTFEIKAVLPDEESRERLDLSCEVIK